MSVKVKRERPDQRRHHRVTAPLFVEIEDARYRVADWSLGGLRIEGYRGAPPALGDTLEAQVTLPFQGFEVSFAAACEVVRADGDGQMLALKFVDLAERESELMQHFIEDIVRGAMSHVNDTIQRIDVPVTPASIKPDPSPIQDVPVRRLPVKTIVMSAAYILGGLAVFSYAAMLIFSNFFNLEVRSAVISAPLEQVKAQADGRVRWAAFQPGDPVVEGDIVLRLYDNKTEREIDLARLAMKERTNEIAYLMRRKVDEIEKVSAFAQIEAKDIAQARLRQDNLAEQVNAARLMHVRAETLYEKGHTAAVRVEQTKKRLYDLEKQLESQKLELETRIKVAERNIGKRHFTGREMIGDLERVSAEIRRAEGLLELDRQRYEVAKTHRERLAVRAPFTGSLLQLPRVNNGHVKAGETIALFEKSGERTVTAFLTQGEILDIAHNADVDVYIPATGEVARARIVGIDRTMGFFRQASKRAPVRLQWRESKERTARVTLAFNDQTAFASDSRYRAGLPVTVNFSRKTGGYITASAQRLVKHAMSHLPEAPRLSQYVSDVWQRYRANAARLETDLRARFARSVKAPKPVLARKETGSRLGAIAGGFKVDTGQLPSDSANLATFGRTGPEL